MCPVNINLCRTPSYRPRSLADAARPARLTCRFFARPAALPLAIGRWLPGLHLSQADAYGCGVRPAMPCMLALLHLARWRLRGPYQVCSKSSCRDPSRRCAQYYRSRCVVGGVSAERRVCLGAAINRPKDQSRSLLQLQQPNLEQERDSARRARQFYGWHRSTWWNRGVRCPSLLPLSGPALSAWRALASASCTGRLRSDDLRRERLDVVAEHVRCYLPHGLPRFRRVLASPARPPIISPHPQPRPRAQRGARRAAAASAASTPATTRTR